jgi:hypothetical protein
MFGIEERQRLRDVLISAAQLDEQISAAALTGSSAAGAEDRWSDIDLAFGLVPEADLALVLAAWTDSMYRDHGAVHDRPGILLPSTSSGWAGSTRCTPGRASPVGRSGRRST